MDAALEAAVIAYFDVVRQQQRVRVFEETVSLSEERARLAAVQFRAGTATELDAGLAQVDLNADRSALLQEKAVLTGLEATLFFLMGRSPDRPADIEATDPLVVDRTLHQEAILQASQASNRSVRAAREGQRVATFAVRESSRDRLPTLSLQSGYQWVGFSAGSQPDPFNQQDTFTYGATLSLRVFDGFNRQRRVDTARIRAENAATAVRREEAATAARVINAFARYRSNLDRLDLETANVDVARRNVDIAYAQLRAGTITAVDLRQVQVSFLTAETRRLEAAFEAKRAETELHRLSGQSPHLNGSG